MSTNQIPESEVVLDPKSTVLVVVDVQNWFAKPGGEFFDAKDQRERDRTMSMIGKLGSFLRKCREEGLKIIFLQTIRTIDDPAFKAWGTKPRVIGGTWDAEIIDELKPLDDEVIVLKSSNDCFIKPDMENVLQKYGRPTRLHVSSGVAGPAGRRLDLVGIHRANHGPHPRERANLDRPRLQPDDSLPAVANRS